MAVAAGRRHRRRAAAPNRRPRRSRAVRSNGDAAGARRPRRGRCRRRQMDGAGRGRHGRCVGHEGARRDRARRHGHAGAGTALRTVVEQEWRASSITATSGSTGCSHRRGREGRRALRRAGHRSRRPRATQRGPRSGDGRVRRAVDAGLDPTPRNKAECLYTTTPDESFVMERVGPVVIGSPCSGPASSSPLIGRTLADLSPPPDRSGVTYAEYGLE